MKHSYCATAFSSPFSSFSSFPFAPSGAGMTFFSIWSGGRPSFSADSIVMLISSPFISGRICSMDSAASFIFPSSSETGEPEASSLWAGCSSGCSGSRTGMTGDRSHPMMDPRHHVTPGIRRLSPRRPCWFPQAGRGLQKSRRKMKTGLWVCDTGRNR